jgi:cytochrome c551/c552
MNHLSGGIATSRIALVAACIILFAHSAYASEVTEEGHILATYTCSACHQVSDGQRLPPPVLNPDEGIRVPAPTFRQIAQKYRGRASSLRRMIVNPRHPMREQEFIESDLLALVTYIQSLDASSPRTRPEPSP